jgi:D-alanyl-D-alanine carboxypeptidase (penicillin-binding protein 5/6)
MRSAEAIVVTLLAVACSTPVFSPPAAAARPNIESVAAVLMDADTGAVLYSRSMHERRPMASTTKIMTALLALESADLPPTITAGPVVQTVTGSSLYLAPEDTIRREDLVAALLIQSANDAAAVVAQRLGGSIEGFAALMNKRAVVLGALDTHFVNPHGLYDPDHYSSAYDLALITRAAYRHERFAELVATKATDVTVPSAPDGVRRLINHNKLLWRADFVDGVKTGYVRQSGHCLVASGTKDGWRLISVVLDSPDMYAESLSLLQYGFESFDRQVYARPGDAVGRARVRGGLRQDVPVVCEAPLSYVSGPDLREPRLEVSLLELDAPVSEGGPAGTARLVSQDRVLVESALVAAEAVPSSRLRVFALWFLRIVIMLAILVLLTRTYAKAVKGHRRRRSHFPA